MVLLRAVIIILIMYKTATGKVERGEENMRKKVAAVYFLVRGSEGGQKQW
jgi:hypothetical protein